MDLDPLALPHLDNQLLLIWIAGLSAKSDIQIWPGKVVYSQKDHLVLQNEFLVTKNYIWMICSVYLPSSVGSTVSLVRHGSSVRVTIRESNLVNQLVLRIKDINKFGMLIFYRCHQIKKISITYTRQLSTASLFGI